MRHAKQANEESDIKTQKKFVNHTELQSKNAECQRKYQEILKTPEKERQLQEYQAKKHERQRVRRQTKKMLAIQSSESYSIESGKKNSERCQ